MGAADLFHVLAVTASNEKGIRPVRSVYVTHRFTKCAREVFARRT